MYNLWQEQTTPKHIYILFTPEAAYGSHFFGINYRPLYIV